MAYHRNAAKLNGLEICLSDMNTQFGEGHGVVHFHSWRGSYMVVQSV